MTSRLWTSTLSGGAILVAFVLATGTTLADTGSEPQGALTTPAPGSATTTPGQPGTVTSPSQEPSSPGAGKQQPTSAKPKPPKHKGGKPGNPSKPKTKGKKKAKQGKKAAKPSDSGSDVETPSAEISNLQIEQFDLPLFALPIFDAAGSEYGVPPELLWAINYFETNFGTNLSVSSAGAVGWMQFMPATWKSYATDANRNGYADPYDPTDAIFAAARYLRAAAGPDGDMNLFAKDDAVLRKAVFAYNHADWYVDEVVDLARRYARLPNEFVNTLTGMSQGYFPVRDSRVRYTSEARGKTAKIYARGEAAVVAATSGTIVELDTDRVVLRDTYGNRYIYDNLSSVESSYPAPKLSKRALERFRRQAARDIRDADRERDLPQPDEPASAGSSPASGNAASDDSGSGDAAGAAVDSGYEPRGPSLGTKERIYAHPDRARNRRLADRLGQGEGERPGGQAWTVFRARYQNVLNDDRGSYELKPFRVGAKVAVGTQIGRLGSVDAQAASTDALSFKVRPAGKGAPAIHPGPLLKTWQLTEQASERGLHGENPLTRNLSAGEPLLLEESILRARVLADPRLSIYGCGRADIRDGTVKKPVLGMLEFLAESGFRLTVTSLKCGHSYLTASGNVSAHSYGLAADIAAINGQSVLGHQQPGGLPDRVIDRLNYLMGAYQPDQIISLIDKGRDNTLVLSDHDDHIHVGYRINGGNSAKIGRHFKSILSNGQWERLGERLAKTKDPIVPRRPSKFAIRVKRR